MKKAIVPNNAVIVFRQYRIFKGQIRLEKSSLNHLYFSFWVVSPFKIYWMPLPAAWSFCKFWQKIHLFPWGKIWIWSLKKENVQIFCHFSANFTPVLLMASDSRKIARTCILC